MCHKYFNKNVLFEFSLFLIYSYYCVYTSAVKFQIIYLKYQILNFSVQFLKYRVFYNI